MNLDSFDERLQDNLLAQIPTERILILIFLSCLVGYGILRLMKNQYEGVRLAKRYLVYLPIHLVIGYFLVIPVVFNLGTYLLGGVFTFFKSTRYFYE